MKNIKLVINNDLKKEKEKFFIKKELQCILNLYAKMVSNGTWKDYSFSSGSREISFDVYQRASDQPVLRILKNFRKFLLKKVFPTINVIAKITLIIVGFMYKKTGLLKYNVNPPNTEIMIPPTSGI